MPPKKGGKKGKKGDDWSSEVRRNPARAATRSNGAAAEKARPHALRARVLASRPRIALAVARAQREERGAHARAACRAAPRRTRLRRRPPRCVSAFRAPPPRVAPAAPARALAGRSCVFARVPRAWLALPSRRRRPALSRREGFVGEALSDAAGCAASQVEAKGGKNERKQAKGGKGKRGDDSDEVRRPDGGFGLFAEAPA